MGATGWIAGLVNALPDESVLLFEHAIAGRIAEARALYDWFLPLLRLDTVPKFVQLIKLVQEEVGLGSERVRAPREMLVGAEREMALAIIRERLASKPATVGVTERSPIDVIDSHTEGEPTRVVLAGWPEPSGRDDGRPPRVHASASRTSCAAGWCASRAATTRLSERCSRRPNVPDAAAGVVFFNDVGYLGMCGHGMIGVVRTLQHLGRVSPGHIELDTPVGPVSAELAADGAVTIRNVPARVHRTDVTVRVPGCRRRDR